MKRCIRRQKIKTIEVGNIIQIGADFHRVHNIIKHPITNQAFVTYTGDEKYRASRKLEVVEFTLDTFVNRQRQIEG